MPRVPLPPPEEIELVPLAQIASGGMGSVELARAQGGRFDGLALAIKRLHPNIARDRQFVDMFLDEAWMTAALDHSNVVRVAAWGRDRAGMFLAVELVQGVSLARLFKEAARNGERFAERTVAYVGSQVCAGLAAAHGLRGAEGQPLGLVHRDLTPGNLLVGFDGVVKIADFGIAKAEERITHTRTGTLKGKPAYMAPEQARGGKVDARADLFAFGVVLFEMLAGRRPWTAKAAFEVMMQVATEKEPDLASLRPGVSADLTEIVGRCLAKAPDERFSSAAEIQRRLDAWRVAKGFDRDDAESLGRFVERNSAQQREWFRRALAGELATSTISYADLEELKDEQREADQGGRRPVRPAAGRAPPLPAGANARAPSARAPAPPSSAAQVPPAVPVADPTTDSDLAATRMHDPRRSSAPEPRSTQPPSVSQLGLGGTYVMGPPRSSSSPPLSGPAVPSSNPPFHAFSPPVYAGPPHATRAPSYGAASRHGCAPPEPRAPAPPIATPPPLVTKRRRVVLLGLAVLSLLAAGASAVWWSRAGLSASGAADETPTERGGQEGR